MAPQLRLPGEGLRSLLFQRFRLCAAPINSDSTTWHAWTQFHASLVQIDVHHHLSKGRLPLQESVARWQRPPTCIYSLTQNYPRGLPELPQRPTPGPRIAPTFWAVLLKENKAMVFFWRPESGRHFGSRTVVQGSTFGGLVVSLLVGFWAASRT